MSSLLRLCDANSLHLLHRPISVLHSFGSAVALAPQDTPPSEAPSASDPAAASTPATAHNSPPISYTSLKLHHSSPTTRCCAKHYDTSYGVPPPICPPDVIPLYFDGHPTQCHSNAANGGDERASGGVGVAKTDRVTAGTKGSGRAVLRRRRRCQNSVHLGDQANATSAEKQPTLPR